MLLGDDGRVWDGHHRLLAKMRTGDLYDWIPVVYGTTNPEDVAILGID